jgi:hypothetical protein
MFRFEKDANIDDADKSFLFVDFYEVYGSKKRVYELGFRVLDVERERFEEEGTLPISSVDGNTIWVNENGFAHRIKGPAFETIGYPDEDVYYIDGIELTKEEWEIKTRKRFYFLREKIITLKKLLEIPELYNEVYYSRKNKFIELLNKI